MGPTTTSPVMRATPAPRALTATTASTASGKPKAQSAKKIENAETKKARKRKMLKSQTFLKLGTRSRSPEKDEWPRKSEDYEKTKSGRESWWRKDIRETPLPGTYDHYDFIDEVDKKQNTYRFKSDGRKRDAHPWHKGAALMPGAYEHKDFLSNFDKFNTTYGFKSTKRDARDFLNFGKKDKDINVAPNQYTAEKYLTCSVEKQPSKHFMFKSQSQRFPTKYFRPKIGPAPGNYEHTPPDALHPISSSFKSRTPRFSTSHTRVPGPGSYEKTFQSPMPATIARMGKQHGLFFSSAFQV
ncbi:unnamed protein product [Owenia fusiformis]|uniref:Uncharacterized protein n=1 Tax=Owenia fusiformis TaxID=6347 RepID=A0A8J1UL79_OWEFU|nr:unnamed protein product [Owenia fusiformis]